MLAGVVDDLLTKIQVKVQSQVNSSERKIRRVSVV